MTDSYTSVQMTTADAQLFVEMQKHYAFVKLMESIGAFEIKSGSVTVHFDALGAIGSVDIQRHFRP